MIAVTSSCKYKLPVTVQVIYVFMKLKKHKNHGTMENISNINNLDFQTTMVVTGVVTPV